MGESVVRLLVWVVVATVASHAPGQPAGGATLGPSAGREVVSRGPIPELSPGPAWVFPASDPAVVGPLAWDPASRVAIGPERVFVVSRQLAGEPARLIAIDRRSGLRAWWAELPEIVLDSWSGPTLDPVNGAVLVPVGRAGPDGGVVLALDEATGVLRWQAPLQRDAVNSEVVVTTDLGAADRAFIVDYEGFFQGGAGAALVCINVDPFDAQLNPHQPGDVVWSLDLLDGASGATPAYQDGRLYLGTTGDAFFGIGGSVLCVRADAASAHEALVWRTPLGGDDGVFGPVSAQGDAVFAATYDFYGGGRSSRLVKLDALSGAVRWEIASDRSSSAPIPLGNGRVLLSAGIDGFGSVPRLTLYEDLGGSAVETWDTALDSWQDDGDGVIDPGEFMNIGGWSYRPVVRIERGTALAVVGRASTTPGVLVVDLDRTPSDSGFVVGETGAGGGTVAAGWETLYAVGEDGVAAFGSPTWSDVDGDQRADLSDLRSWHLGVGRRDVDLDGVMDDLDAAALEAFVRRSEVWDMVAGRRP